MSRNVLNYLLLCSRNTRSFNLTSKLSSQQEIHSIDRYHEENKTQIKPRKNCQSISNEKLRRWRVSEHPQNNTSPSQITSQKRSPCIHLQMTAPIHHIFTPQSHPQSPPNRLANKHSPIHLPTEDHHSSNHRATKLLTFPRCIWESDPNWDTCMGNSFVVYSWAPVPLSRSRDGVHWSEEHSWMWYLA